MVVRNKPEFLFCLHTVALDGMTENGDFAFLERQYPRQTFERSRLTRAVDTKQSDYLSPAAHKGNVLDRIILCTRIFFAEIVYFHHHVVASVRATVCLRTCCGALFGRG